MRFVVMLLVLAGCTVDADREREIARVRTHLERVERDLQASPASPARARTLADLRAYIEAEQYPTNRVSDEMTPIFIDDDGARCAMAALIEATGDTDLVERVARDHDYAYIEALAGDPALAHWLDTHGLTLAEAARIQPAYANTVAHRWVPTAGLVGSLQAGVGGEDHGVEAVIAGGARLGVRRITKSNDACDRCVNRSTALVAEYRRSLVAGGGSTNQLGLLVEYGIDTHGADNQAYLIGGVLVSLDENAAPGSGFGGEIGAGFSFRGGARPIFVEFVATGFALDSAAVHGGVDFGIVW
jgi:hypothetical protein